MYRESGITVLLSREINFNEFLNEFHSFSACDWLFTTEVTAKLLNSGRIKAWVDRESWWSASLYQRSLVGLVWFCQLETNHATLSLFNYHHGTGPWSYCEWRTCIDESKSGL